MPYVYCLRQVTITQLKIRHYKIPSMGAWSFNALQTYLHDAVPGLLVPAVAGKVAGPVLTKWWTFRNDFVLLLLFQMLMNAPVHLVRTMVFVEMLSRGTRALALLGLAGNIAQNVRNRTSWYTGKHQIVVDIMLCFYDMRKIRKQSKANLLLICKCIQDSFFVALLEMKWWVFNLFWAKCGKIGLGMLRGNGWHECHLLPTRVRGPRVREPWPGDRPSNALLPALFLCCLRSLPSLPSIMNIHADICW